MKELIELTKKIKDKKLRDMVIEFLKDPKLSHKDFKKYPKMKMEEALTPFVGGSMGAVERDVLNHTIVLTELCDSTAEIVEKRYGIPIEKDYLIAAAILHDLMKLFEWKKGIAGMEPTGVMLDHSMLGVAELYHRGFPEKVIHIVASHFGESGPTPPRSFEALIMHHLDTMISMTEYNLYAMTKPQQMPIVLLDEETIKQLGDTAGKESKEKSKAD